MQARRAGRAGCQQAVVAGWLAGWLGWLAGLAGLAGWLVPNIKSKSKTKTETQTNNHI